MRYRLGNICSYIARGITPKYIDESNCIVINQKCIRNNVVNLDLTRLHNNNAKNIPLDKKLRKFDILINSTGVGTAGRVSQLKTIKTDGILTVDSHVTIVRPNADLVLPAYLGFYLCYIQKQIEELAIGSTGQTEISRQSISDLEIDLPDLETQKKVVRILSALDNKIELNNQQNQTLYEIGKKIYIEKFENNQECERIQLSNFFPVITGKKDANASSENGKYPFFTCSKTISKIDNFAFDASAILLAGNGDFNVKFYRGKFDAYQRTYVLIPHEEKYLGFLYWAISHNLPKITANYRGSVIKFITKGNIENFEVPFIDNQYIKILMNLLLKIEQNNQENESLTNIRDTLLPKLMNGEIDLGNVGID